MFGGDIVYTGFAVGLRVQQKNCQEGSWHTYTIPQMILNSNKMLTFE